MKFNLHITLIELELGVIILRRLPHLPIEAMSTAGYVYAYD
jgi:hypothetical protein